MKRVAICKKRRITSELEVSGNVTLETFALSGVDIQRISVGVCIRLSLGFEPGLAGKIYFLFFDT